MWYFHCVVSWALMVLELVEGGGLIMWPTHVRHLYSEIVHLGCCRCEVILDVCFGFYCHQPAYFV